MPNVESVYDSNAGYFKPDYAPELADIDGPKAE